MVETGYKGNVDAAAAWTALAEDAESVLVDVRTMAEWNFVGIPDLAGLGKSVVLIEWQTFPTMATNERFVDDLDDALVARGLDRAVAVYFLCRSGARSQAAAIAATAAGFASAYNVTGGFEGPLDAERHRGTTAGWKAAGLAWIQS